MHKEVPMLPWSHLGNKCARSVLGSYLFRTYPWKEYNFIFRWKTAVTHATTQTHLRNENLDKSFNKSLPLFWCRLVFFLSVLRPVILPSLNPNEISSTLFNCTRLYKKTWLFMAYWLYVSLPFVQRKCLLITLAQFHVWPNIQGLIRSLRCDFSVLN